MILLHSYIDIKDSYIDIKGGPFLGIVNMLVFWHKWSFFYGLLSTFGFFPSLFSGQFLPFDRFFVATCFAPVLFTVFPPNHFWIAGIFFDLSKSPTVSN